MASPPSSPIPSHTPPRPMSAMIRPARSASRLSMSSRPGGSSRASDEDSKTAVKVAIRVRPALRPNDPGYDLIPQRFQKSAVQVMSPTSLAVDSPQGKKIFVFDRVFSEEVGQDGVWEYLQESVSAFVQGYNVSLLAYGQSGAGKSYTMGTASPGDQSSHGIIPRAAHALFEHLGASQSGARGASGLRAPVRYSQIGSPKPATNKTWSIKATYVEIYNESLRDLLINDTSMHDRPQVSIREDKSGRILLTGLHELEINSYDDLVEALTFGSSIRQTDATAINAKSSRSHAVFSLNLIQKKPRPQTEKEKRNSLPLDMMAQGSEAGYITVDSKLHFVDLAGSERLKNTMAQGERAKEGISINAGLASLGKVISQLSSRHPGSHVSYRDSKLTRLLQDSLGGNAITYMVACVTPAEFHLSETLNTVQYAQRARAIQSKPRIQQVSEEGDTKALIERLRAEIAFLREQLRNSNTSDSGERVGKISTDRPERTHEREMELQNQLLDLQEHYSALSQRHTKLISELTREYEADNSAAVAEHADSAERLKRSNLFAHQVEQVVLEYEKTIQSLESSLSNTRSSLSSTESSLLEKETKLAYIEAVNQQLQSRVQKMMDRESATENYLQDLEAKLSGHTSGEEKNAVVVAELRKEIARMRENEAGQEDYISTLEDKLAEADQNVELMAKQIAQLQDVVDRQRSLGKVEAMLAAYASPGGETKVTNGTTKSDGDGTEASAHSKMVNGHSHSGSLRTNGYHETIAEEESTLGKENSTALPTVRERRASKARDLPEVSISSSGLVTEPQTCPPQSPAQTEFVHDKLENVQQELFELKVEHESTINELDQVSANYEATLRELSRLRDKVDELQHGKQLDTPRTSSPPPSPSPMRPVSFLSGTRVSELKDLDSSSSRSLASELSVVDSTIGEGCDEAESAALQKELETLRTLHQEQQEKEDTLSAQIENIRKEHMEKQERIAALQKERERIQADHKEALALVEELKRDVAEARTQSIASSGIASHLIRRKSSQSLMMLDRAQRSFTSLRKIAEPYLETHPESLENFDSNIDEVMHELHMRSERIQELENEITALRRDLENKSTMISGLTRERSSKSSSPMDISVIAVMERRIDEAELEAQCLRRQVAEREEEHNKEVQSLRDQLLASVNEAKTLVTSLLEAQKKLSETTSLSEQQTHKVMLLQQEMETSAERHNTTIESLKENVTSLKLNERHLLEMIAELEAAMRKLEESRLEAANKASAELERTMKGFEDERAKQQDLVNDLQQAIEEHKSTIDGNFRRIAELEEAAVTAQAQLEGKLAEAEESSRSEVSKHRETISQISNEVSEKLKLIEGYETRLSGLQSALDDALSQVSNLNDSEAAVQAALKESEARVAELVAATEAKVVAGETIRIQHEAELAATKESYEQRLKTTRTILEENNKTVDSQNRRLEILEKSLREAQDTIDALEKNRDMVAEAQEDRAQSSEAIANDLAQTKKQIAAQVETIKELQNLHAESQEQLEKLSKKEAKHARVIEDLEQQLAFTFDQNQDTITKLASVSVEIEQLQAERKALVDEAAKRGNDIRVATDELNNEVASLKVQLAEAHAELASTKATFRAERSNSMSKDLRKSTSATSLPSPPPAIPLPPLPTNGTAPSGSPPPVAPTSPNMSRRPSKDYVAAHIEDQEARIKTLEKQLLAEKALTQTLEDALTDCEKTMKRLTADRESLQLKAQQVQEELERTKNDTQNSRYSMQAVEDERIARIKAEQAREKLEQRMEQLNRKNKRSFACF